MKQHTRTILALIILSFLLTLPVHAKKSLSDAPDFLSKTSAPTGITEQEVTNIVGSVIAFALQIVGLFFFILMVYAGFRWMLSRGEEDEITKARDTIVGAVIGLVITVSAYAITSFINTRVISGDGGGPGSPSADITGGGTAGEATGCCISWTKADILLISKSSWKIMTKSTCNMMNTDVQFDPANENKYAVGGCAEDGGAKAGCWLFFANQDAKQCQATWEEGAYNN